MNCYIIYQISDNLYVITATARLSKIFRNCVNGPVSCWSWSPRKPQWSGHSTLMKSHHACTVWHSWNVPQQLTVTWYRRPSNHWICQSTPVWHSSLTVAQFDAILIDWLIDKPVDELARALLNSKRPLLSVDIMVDMYDCVKQYPVQPC